MPLHIHPDDVTKKGVVISASYFYQKVIATLKFRLLWFALEERMEPRDEYPRQSTDVQNATAKGDPDSGGLHTWARRLVLI
jgi:hypothetical protein